MPCEKSIDFQITTTEDGNRKTTNNMRKVVNNRGEICYKLIGSTQQDEYKSTINERRKKSTKTYKYKETTAYYTN